MIWRTLISASEAGLEVSTGAAWGAREPYWGGYIYGGGFGGFDPEGSDLGEEFGYITRV